MRKRLTNILLSYLGVLWLSAQDIPTGTWRNHFNFSNAQIVVGNDEHIFCASRQGLFSFDKQSLDLNRINKQKGSGDVGVSAMTYDMDTETLIVGYRSGVIDLIRADGISNIFTLSTVDIEGSKAVRDFVFDEGRLFGATDLGVILIDLESAEVRDVYRNIGPGASPISSGAITIHDDSLFAVTDQGILKASTSDNLLDFNNWYQGNAPFEVLDFFSIEGQLYAFGTGDTSVQYADGNWQNAIVFPEPVVTIEEFENQHYALSTNRLYEIVDGEIVLIIDNDLNDAKDLWIDSDGTWIADSQFGLLHRNMGNMSRYFPSGPLAADITRMKRIDDEIWLFYAESPDEYTGQSDTLGISRFDGSWHIEKIPGFHNISGAAFNGFDILLSSLGNGLYNFSSGQMITEIESELLLSDITVSGGSFWITSYDNNVSLYRVDEQNEITNFTDLDIGTQFPTSIQASTGGVLWIGIGASMNYGFNVYEPITDSFRRLTTSDGLLNNRSVLGINQSDEAWLGSENGLVVFSDATFIFDNEDAFVPFFNGAPLFENESVTSLSFDGGNRNWIGTDQGLWLFDENLTEVIDHFTTTNSPLPSNSVQDLTFNGATGELFVLTAAGLVSYQTATSDPKERHSNVKIYPNPIDARFDNVLTISGLTGNAEVKITDIEGQIIADLRATGSSLSWDLTAFNGQRAVPGVYLVYSSNFDGEETYIGKFVIQ